MPKSCIIIELSKTWKNDLKKNITWEKENIASWILFPKIIVKHQNTNFVCIQHAILQVSGDACYIHYSSCYPFIKAAFPVSSVFEVYWDSRTPAFSPSHHDFEASSWLQDMIVFMLISYIIPICSTLLHWPPSIEAVFFHDTHTLFFSHYIELVLIKHIFKEVK